MCLAYRLAFTTNSAQGMTDTRRDTAWRVDRDIETRTHDHSAAALVGNDNKMPARPRILLKTYISVIFITFLIQFHTTSN